MPPVSDFHEFLYGDPRRVRDARVQAKGRIAARVLRDTYVGMVSPFIEWLVARLSR